MRSGHNPEDICGTLYLVLGVMRIKLGVWQRQMNPAVATVVVVLCIAWLFAAFGSGDIEESANSSYSSGASFHTSALGGREVGTRSVLGVPVFDTLQGTGDRLPYQASWGQSVTWWLRAIVSWEHYSLLRSILFALPGIWFCLSTVRSWLPRSSIASLAVFGLLSSSSFGLLLRQNEWSDHYVQTISVIGISMLFMHRHFHDSSLGVPWESHPVSVTGLAILLNGVVTGHPGYWPIALAVWLSLGCAFATSEVFRSQTAAWVRNCAVSLSLVGVATTASFIAVSFDLISEMAGQSFTTGRLERTQGLFSQYAFGGFYGLSSGGSIPHAVKVAFSSLFGTTLIPFFILFDQWLPQSLRASDFRELTRVEFSGLLVLLGAAAGWSRMRGTPHGGLIARLTVAQALIWLFVIGSAADLLPSVLAPSGAWMTLAVVLVFNVFLGWLLLGNLWSGMRLPRNIVIVHLSLVAVWCLFQFGFVSFGSVFQIPARHESWFKSAEILAKTDWLRARQNESARILIVQTPSVYDFLPMVTLGQPVVATADPKMRSSNHLQGSHAFNYSINPPTFADIGRDDLARILNFLQIRSILVGAPPSSRTEVVSDSSGVISRLDDTVTKSHRIDLPRVTFDVYSRSTFSAFLVHRASFEEVRTCPILQQNCPVLVSSTATAESSAPKLTLCEKDCLWRFMSPTVAADKALLLPVTYDNTFVVRDAGGTQLNTANLGGFLAVFGDGAINDTELTIGLKPDFRMLSRVVVSYLNIVMIIALILIGICSRQVSRRRARRHGLGRTSSEYRTELTNQSVSQPR